MIKYLKQGDDPLFPKIFWNRPISHIGGNNLTMIGGYSGSCNQLQLYYSAITAGGIYDYKIIMPDSLIKIIGQDNEAYYFVAANKSGSLAKAALGEILEIIRDTTAISIGDNLSDNSETTILIESLLHHLEKKSLILWGGAIDRLIKYYPEIIKSQPKCLLVLDAKQLFRYANVLKISTNDNKNELENKIGIGLELARKTKANFLVASSEIIAIVDKEVSLTFIKNTPNKAIISGVATAFWLQNTHFKFESLTSAAYTLAQAYQNTNSISSTDYLKQIKKFLIAY